MHRPAANRSTALRFAGLALAGLLILGGLSGCSASPTPMTILMPTYSFERDGADPMSDAAPVRFDRVAAVE